MHHQSSVCVLLQLEVIHHLWCTPLRHIPGWPSHHPNLVASAEHVSSVFFFKFGRKKWKDCCCGRHVPTSEPCTTWNCRPNYVSHRILISCPMTNYSKRVCNKRWNNHIQNSTAIESTEHYYSSIELDFFSSYIQIGKIIQGILTKCKYSSKFIYMLTISNEKHKRLGVY